MFLVNNPKEWLQSKEPVRTATALYDFYPASQGELPLKTGQKVWIAPQSLQPKNFPGWCRATDSINVGLIPASYVTVVGQLTKKSDANQSSASDIQHPPEINENLPVKTETAESQFVNDFNDNKNENNFDTSKNAEIFELKNEDNIVNN